MEQVFPPEPNDEQINQLEKAIEMQKNKLLHYEQLQKQIKDISKSLSHSGQPSKPQHSKSNSKVSEKQARHSMAKSSNKKIKLYELQKKLKKLTNEYNQKESTLDRHKRKEQQLLRQIQKTSKSIDQQKKIKQSLLELEHKIDKDIERAQEDVSDEVVSLEESIKRKQMFSFQRTKIRDQLNKLHIILGKKDPRYKIQTVLDLSLSSSIREQNENNEYNSSECLNLQQSQQWIIKEKQRMSQLYFKMQNHRQINLNALNRFYQLKKQFTRQEILAKHHRLTTNLQSSQVKSYQTLIQQSKKRISEIETKSEKVLNEVKKIEGDRGYLRGKVGVLIEQLRMISGVNTLISADVEVLQDRCSYLNLLKDLLKQKS